jgi:hypothetical protein
MGILWGGSLDLPLKISFLVNPIPYFFLPVPIPWTLLRCPSVTIRLFCLISPRNLSSPCTYSVTLRATWGKTKLRSPNPTRHMRPNSWTKSRQKSAEFSSLLFTVTFIALFEISVSSNSRNLLQFLEVNYCTL